MPASLSGMKLLTSFKELRPFFLALTMHGQTIGTDDKVMLNFQRKIFYSFSFQKCSTVFWRDTEALSGRLGHSAAVARLEQALFVDFAEHWQL